MSLCVDKDGQELSVCCSKTNGPPWPERTSKIREQAGSVKCTGSRERAENGRKSPRLGARLGCHLTVDDDLRSVISLLAPLNSWGVVRI